MREESKVFYLYEEEGDGGGKGAGGGQGCLSYHSLEESLKLSFVGSQHSPRVAIHQLGFRGDQEEPILGRGTESRCI